MLHSCLMYYAKGYPGIWDLTKRQCGIRENVDGMRDLTKIQCGIRETLTGSGIWPEYSAGVGKRWRDTGFDQKTVRDSGKHWRDTGFDCCPENEIRQNLGKDANKERKCYLGSIATKEVWEAEFSWKSRQSVGITTSIPSTQGQLQNGINSQGKQHCPIHWLLLKMQFQTFINTSNHYFCA